MSSVSSVVNTHTNPTNPAKPIPKNRLGRSLALPKGGLRIENSSTVALTLFRVFRTFRGEKSPRLNHHKDTRRLTPTTCPRTACIFRVFPAFRGLKTPKAHFAFLRVLRVLRGKHTHKPHQPGEANPQKPARQEPRPPKSLEASAIKRGRRPEQMLASATRQFMPVFTVLLVLNGSALILCRTGLRSCGIQRRL